MLDIKANTSVGFRMPNIYTYIKFLKAKPGVGRLYSGANSHMNDGGDG